MFIIRIKDKGFGHINLNGLLYPQFGGEITHLQTENVFIRDR